MLVSCFRIRARPLTSGFGGAEGIRTPDLLIANETRYQLRHSPKRWETLAPGCGRSESERSQEPTARCRSPWLRAWRGRLSSASRASWESASVRPEVQTPVESRSMVRTLRGAAGLADVRREGDRHRVPQAGVRDRRDLAGLGAVVVDAAAAVSASRRAASSATVVLVLARAPGRSGPRPARGGPSAGRRRARRRAGRPGWRRTSSRCSRARRRVPVAMLASRIRPRTRRRRLVARRVASRRATTGVAGAARAGTLRGDDRRGRGAAGRDDQARVPAVDRLAAGEHPHGVGEAVDRPAAHHVVVVLERLRDQVDGPRHGEGDEDQRAQVHESEVRIGSATPGRMSTGVSQNNSCDWCEAQAVHCEGQGGSMPSGHSSTVIA